MKITDIKINPGRRKIDVDKVKELAASIEQVGLINPITVSKKNYLIAGAHRIEAFKLLKIANIPHIVMELDGLDVELAEIDENLMRNEIHFVERGELLLRRKQIYEDLYPETQHGKRTGKGNQERVNNLPLAESFVNATAKSLSVSTTTIKQEIQIAKLPEEIKERIIEEKMGKVAALKLIAKPTNGKAKIKKPKAKTKKDSMFDAFMEGTLFAGEPTEENIRKEFNEWFNKIKFQ